MTNDNFVSIVTGGCGFIANTLISNLLDEGRIVVAIDNLSRGTIDNVKKFENENFHFINSDVSNNTQCYNSFKFASQFGLIDEVWHLAANSDIPAGVSDYKIDLKDTFLTTCVLLSTMKLFGVRDVYFASSSAVYGDKGDMALHEGIGPLLPISNYGAMKLASEAIISAAVESHLNKALIFRFPNVVGTPATHGVIYDFINKLISDPSILTVLGDGTQRKSYLHVSDLVSAMIYLRSSHTSNSVEVFNIGPMDDGVTVSSIAEEVKNHINADATIIYGNGNKGWIGDVPKFHYSIEKIRSLGWAPKLNSAMAISLAVKEIIAEFRMKGYLKL